MTWPTLLDHLAIATVLIARFEPELADVEGIEVGGHRRQGPVSGVAFGPTDEVHEYRCAGRFSATTPQMIWGGTTTVVEHVDPRRSRSAQRLVRLASRVQVGRRDGRRTTR